MLARRFVTWLIGATEAALDSLGIGDVSLDVTPRERRLFVVVSILPVLVAMALLYQLAYDIDHPPDNFPFRDSAVYWHIYWSAQFVTFTMPYVALGLLFFHGVAPVGRGFGTWCLVTAVSVTVFALLLAAYGGLVNVITDPGSFSARDWHADIAIDMAENFALIAAGYAFLAYRGLGTDSEPELEPVAE